jgi:uncharacterized membrane protein (UPF0127 family)
MWSILHVHHVFAGAVYLPVQIQSADCKHINVFQVELAIDPLRKMKGLMGREQLPQSHGMLFLWEKPALLSMWMKNTLIPLDMLFIDSNGVIAQIQHNAQPHSTKAIRARRPVTAVLEIPGGGAHAASIRVGDHVLHEHFAHPPACASGTH